MFIALEALYRTALDLQDQQRGVDGRAQRCKIQHLASNRFGLAIDANQQAFTTAALMVEYDLNRRLRPLNQFLGVDEFRGDAYQAAMAFAQFESR